LDLATRTSLSPIRRGFAPGFVNYKKGCTRLAAASDKVYQLLARGQWFSLGTPASSTTKTGRHEIAEILLKVVLNTKNQSINQSIHITIITIIITDRHDITKILLKVALNTIKQNKQYSVRLSLYDKLMRRGE
jgi:hypothetical protein